MTYNSTIVYTLDTICPWTYLGFLRLTKALQQYETDTPDAPVKFTLEFAPYQLYPDFSANGEDKYEWYKKEKYDDSSEKMDMYTQYMAALGRAEGVDFDFHGTIANTLNAHRIIQHLQSSQSPEAARKAVEFSDPATQQLYTPNISPSNAHPSSSGTLTQACLAAGLSEQEARDLVGDESEGLMETKMKINEQAGNGVDSVPYVVFEGKRRDFTLVGAKEVEQYRKVLESVEKELSLMGRWVLVQAYK